MAMMGGAIAQDTDSQQQQVGYLQLAANFCDYDMNLKDWGSPEYCGFVDESSQEYNETLTSECWECGTYWGGWPQDPPNAILAPGGGDGAGYDQSFPRFLSLYCKGDVKIQAVYQVMPSEYLDLYGLGGAGLDGDKTRCSLGKGETPAQVDKDTECVDCGNADCPPLEVGHWYSDTQVLSLGADCPPGADPDGPWPSDSPIMVSIYVDPGMQLNVSEFSATQMANESFDQFG